MLGEFHNSLRWYCYLTDLTVMESLGTATDVVGEIMRLHRSLPARPEIDEVEAAKVLIRNLEREERLKLEGIAKQRKGTDVSEELFKILQDMQRAMVRFQFKEQKMEALKLLDLDGVHEVFDYLIQRASRCLPGYYPESTVTSDSSAISLSSTLTSTTTPTLSSSATATTTYPASSSGYFNAVEHVKASEFRFSKDDTFVRKSMTTFQVHGLDSLDVLVAPEIGDPSIKQADHSGQDREKLTLIKLASLFAVSAKKGTEKLNLKGKLSDQVEWLPDSIKKLSNLISLDLSENKISVLPEAIGELSSLQMLDLCGNRISQLPESIGNLVNLLKLDLGGNQLKSLPPTIAGLVNLQELDVSSNGISHLPEAIGSLVCLKKLDISTNDIEEIPHTIGRCTSLKELHADYNRLKALPEAVGRIGTLEILTVRYNNIRQLPTTVASLTSLRELNASFNELESIPESLCFVTTLVKLNISNNFADLQYLPRSIGNLEMLEELDMCNNQIRVLPDSFGMLSHLRVLNIEGNPLAVPPRDVIAKGAQAVVQYMAGLVAQEQVKSEPDKQKSSRKNLCWFLKSNKRKHNDEA